MKKDLFQTKNGLYTNALYGYVKTLKNIYGIFKKNHKNVYFISCFDSNSKNHFRTELEENYKKNRNIPEGLGHQFGLIREACKCLNIPVLEHKEYEADDIIASICTHSSNEKRVMIITCDKDMFQLINDNVHIYNPIKKIVLKTEDVYEKFSVYPKDMTTYQAIVGDICDSIKGIKGLGPKAACVIVKLINNDYKIYETEKKIIKKAENLKEKFLKEENQQIFSKNLKLVTLCKDLDYSHVLKDCISFESSFFKNDTWVDFSNKYEMKSLV